MEKRLWELDSLRGLASLTVVFSHFLLIFPQMYTDDTALIFIFKYSPLHLFWAGREAVIFFFVLSGFVLSIPFNNGNSPSYISFFIKRAFRIYIPYYVAIMAGIVSKSFLQKGDLIGLSDWFNSFWKLDISLTSLITHLILISDFDTRVIDPVIWSLVYEMRISLLFPLLMCFVCRYNWKLCFGTSIAIEMLFRGLIAIHKKGILSIGIDASTLDAIYMTVHFTVVFVVGALLAKHKRSLVELCSASRKSIKLALFTLGLALYISDWLTFHYINLFLDYLIAIGVSIIIVTSLSSESISRLLMNRFVVVLGKISYSLYLLHFIVLCSCLYLLYGIIPIWIVLMIAFIASITVSLAGYYWVEVPSIQWGKKLSEWAMKKDVPAKQN